MNFLKPCLWCCIAALGLTAVCAQSLTPEQEKEAREALRRALDQAQPSAPIERKAAEKARKQAEAKQKKEAKQAADEKRRMERRAKDNARSATAAPAPIETPRSGSKPESARDAEARAKAEIKAKAESEARRIAAQQQTSNSPPGIAASDEAVAREALRKQLEQPTTRSVGSPVTNPASVPPPAESARRPIVIQTTPAGDPKPANNSDPVAREALRKQLDSPTPAAKSRYGSDLDAEKLARERAKIEADSQRRAKREADRIMAERARATEDAGRKSASVSPPASLPRASVSPGAPEPARVAPQAVVEKPAVTAVPRPVSSAPPSETPTKIATAEGSGSQRKVEAPRAEPMANPVRPALSAAEEATAREALRKKMEEMDSTASVTSDRNTPSATPSASNAKMKAESKSKADADRKAKKEAEAKAAAERKEQTRMERKRQEEAKVSASSKAKPAQKPASATDVKPSQNQASPPATSNVPSSKSQRLSALLDAYRHDQITPAEYHQQRAKILAEP